jgi:hypothetical protein
VATQEQINASDSFSLRVIIGTALTGISLLITIAATVLGLGNATGVVICTVLFACFVATIFMSHTVRDYLTSHHVLNRLNPKLAESESSKTSETA